MGGRGPAERARPGSRAWFGLAALPEEDFADTARTLAAIAAILDAR